MAKSKLISIFFMLLMLIQVLPVQQIGCALSQNQWTEELPHNCESCYDGKLAKAYLPGAAYYYAYDAYATSLINIYFCDRVPSNHSTDVVSPPPDLS